MKTGKLIKVSMYGFQIEGDENWHNFIKNRNQVFSENCKKHLNKIIAWEENEKGQVIRVGIPSQKDYDDAKEEPKQVNKSNSKSVKLIVADTPELFESEINSFNSKVKVIATQTHIWEGKFVAVIYYD